MRVIFKFLCLIIIFNRPCFSQEYKYEVLNNELLKISFAQDSSFVRFKNEAGNYLNGQKKIIYLDGSRSLVSFIDGFPDGKWVIEDNEGVIISISDYKKGMKHGYAIYYYLNGNKRFVAKYINGYQEGKQEMYYYSGILGGEFYCKHGKKHGIETWYNEEDNSIKKISYFIEGKEVDKSEYLKRELGSIPN
ncbi:hypothetical protein [Seonamhaeicola sp.]|uniref:toxin-antitoxin system YwqK family antitoxin n=1 Tax=Seonamhaeicola sp. TaxID=1912245 RepID=UPI0026210660|nr:hypothetical protein [Seonamhaeicola sp.]